MNIKQGVTSLLAGLSIGLMFCLYFVRDKSIVECHSSGPFVCKVLGPNMVLLTAKEDGEPWEVTVVLEKK
jgi:hypothetical protein